jgi:Reverse transcriptase (RNA-dependent DNA polymerase)
MRGMDLDMLNLDYRKAFDTVPLRQLVNKLQHYRIKGKALDWTVGFLTNQKMQTVVNNDCSDWEDVYCRVLQVSILGSLLYCSISMICPM